MDHVTILGLMCFASAPVWGVKRMHHGKIGKFHTLVFLGTCRRDRVLASMLYNVRMMFRAAEIITLVCVTTAKLIGKLNGVRGSLTGDSLDDCK